jgi:hypothetical protein
VKAAYQKYMRDVVTAAHQHFHEHVSKVRGSSSTAAPSQTRGIPRVDKALKDAGG